MKKLRPTRTLFSPQDVINSSDSDLPTNKSTSMTNSPEVRRQLFGNDDNTTSQTIDNQQHLTKVSDTWQFPSNLEINLNDSEQDGNSNNFDNDLNEDHLHGNDNDNDSTDNENICIDTEKSNPYNNVTAIIPINNNPSSHLLYSPDWFLTATHSNRDKSPK